jgi:GT2 family glycosyltransferase
MNIPRSLTVGIASRNRPESLARCIASLDRLGDLVREVIVVDDGSAPLLEPQLRAGLPASAQERLRVIRFDPGRGVAASRSESVRLARTPWVLNLDDDAVILSAESVERALSTLAADPAVFAVAFAQAEADGTPWPAGAQPAATAVPARVAAFIGFAHLVARDPFLELGGYRAQLIIHGEERELCLRALDAGLGVVYLPDARVAHLPDPGGRDVRRYLHLTVRNGVLSSIYDDPLLLLCLRVPIRLLSYFRMRRGWGVNDPGGFRAVLRSLRTDLREALALRRAVRWSTIRRWRMLARQAPPYRSPA